jgi:hypothetical protein
MSAALNGAIPSLHALHEEQRLLFFVELLVRQHRWHCHEAARAANLSVLDILRKIRSGGWIQERFGGVHGGKFEEKTIPVPFSRVYMPSPWYWPEFNPIHKKAEEPRRYPVVRGCTNT